MKKIKYTVTDTSVNGRLEALEKKWFMLEQKVESYYLGKEAADEWVKRHPTVTGSSGEWCECKEPVTSKAVPTPCWRCAKPIKPLPSHDTLQDKQDKIAIVILKDKNFEGSGLGADNLARKILEVIHEH